MVRGLYGFGCDGIAEYAGGILGQSDAGSKPVVNCINSFTLTGRHAAEYQIYGGIFGMATPEVSDSWRPNGSNAQSWDTKGYDISYSIGDAGNLQTHTEYSGCAKSDVELDWFANQSKYKMSVFKSSNGKSYLIPSWLEPVVNKVF